MATSGVSGGHARAARLGALAMLALLSGCGGGGGASQGAGAAEAPPAVMLTAEYVPLNQGDRKLMALTPAGQTAFVSAVVGSRRVVDGRDAFEVRDEEGTLNYMAHSATGLVEVPGPGADPLTQAIGTVETLRFGLAAGADAVTLIDRQLSMDLDGDGRADRVQVQLSFRVVGATTVTTPAGTFTDVVQTRSAFSFSIDFANQTRIVVKTQVDEWYARGVGLVRHVGQSEGQPQVETGELVAYRSGALRSDSVAPRFESSTPADGGVLGQDLRLTLRLSERVDAVDAAGAGAVVVANAQGAAVGTQTTLASDGRTLTVQLLGALQDGAYTVTGGPTLVDFAGNALAGQVRVLLDRTGPRLLSSVPAQGVATAAIVGTVSMSFDEDVVLPAGSGARFEILRGDATIMVFEPVVVGSTVSAQLREPLARDAAYTLSLSGATDRAGNGIAGPVRVSFRTDPGPFAAAQRVATDGQAAQLADVDGDGRPDLIFTSSRPDASGSPFPVPYIGVHLALPGGGFGPPRLLHDQWADMGGLGVGGNRLPLHALSSGALVADMDGDGRKDLILTGSLSLVVLRQTGPLQFTAERVRDHAGSDLLLGTIDSDGGARAEIVLYVTEFDTATSQTWRRWVAYARGPSGVWAPRTLVQTSLFGPDIQGPRLMDLDGDGRPELVWLRVNTLSGLKELVWTAFQAGGMSAQRSMTLPVGNGFNGWVAGHLDANGQPDLVWLEGEEVVVQRDVLAPSPPALQRIRLRSWANNVVIGDLNGDGLADLVCEGNWGQVAVVLQSPGGGFDAARYFAVPGGHLGSLFAVHDVDGDGRKDLLVGGHVLAARPYPGTWPLAAVPDVDAGRARILSTPTVPATFMPRWIRGLGLR